ncbi:MAG: hypothetical protein COZ06_22185 [Armatimonadetes bacterium CG_4_10_14_3_um_filter_66_18]|nr:JAB domain-containing protein [Armatimonadota bacterium]OIP01173.1 MAG: hypothetical protein AUJ96_17750 [Armatimonadetes bacterium CG2_30_66_41]PIU94950.1 MAG: hypothetical protein COS65_05005 [Armatimonadetes bacterium CG06_land_8_20_14_3_00_66_21]PIX50090.1 MAG: hypothetical protein COZ57_00750 [Armatimonadetes bacterium CG_4_8_14_3_um_filter_66_20]PIY43747.1 MAG: hypothetical protein COZ06_22185 [Armatimonadetes bacterium CG_4_10_14_3_um_filter_66_18]PIZ31553.1 MAG: hypothetical protein
MKDMPEDTRPRERLLQHGPEALSTVELLAILLRTGTPSETAMGLAQRLLSSGGLRHLLTASSQELCAVPGIGPAKVAQLKGALELGRRACQLGTEERPLVRTPADAAALVMSEMRFRARETLRVLCLDARHQLVAVVDVSEGTASAAVAHPRECYREAVRRNATAVVFVHNHPSGDPSASAEDVALTRKLKAAGDLLGIELVDHVIIGDGRYESLRERGLI